MVSSLYCRVPRLYGSCRSVVRGGHRALDSSRRVRVRHPPTTVVTMDITKLSNSELWRALYLSHLLGNRNYHYELVLEAIRRDLLTADGLPYGASYAR